MATVDTLITEVLEDLGEEHVPASHPFRARVRRQLARTYEVRIPQYLGSHFHDGVANFVIGDSGSPLGADPTGIYSWDDTELPQLTRMRSARVPATVDGEELDWVTHPETMWRLFDPENLATATPEAVLVYNRIFQIRPIPLPIAGGYDIQVYGTFYPAAWPAGQDANTTVHIALEDALIKGAVTFLALSTGKDSVAARAQPAFEAALRNLKYDQAASTPEYWPQSYAEQESDF